MVVDFKELKGHPNIVCLKGAFLSSEGHWLLACPAA